MPPEAGPVTALDPQALLGDSFLLDPYPVFEQLRRGGAAVWNEPTQCWYIAGYDAVSGLLRDARLSAAIGAGFASGLSDQQRRSVRDVRAFFDAWPMFSDPPGHTELRGCAAPHYRPRVLADERSRIAAIARRLLSCCADDGLDLAADFAQPLAVQVACGLLGITDEYRSSVLQWSASIMRFIGVPRLDVSRAADTRAAVAQLREYVQSVTVPRAQRGEGPPQMRALIGLPPGQATALFAQLLTGGIEPVVGSLTATLLAMLTQTPGLLTDTDYQSPSGVREAELAAEEGLRYEAPFHYVPRTARVDFTVGEAAIRAADRVFLVIAAANRDPGVFPAPDRFQPGQGTRPHLSFGAGAHFCLGAPVARLILVEGIRAFSGWLGGRPVAEVADIRRPAFGHIVWDRATVAL